MKNNFLLKTKGAVGLYEGVRDLPIIDFHNHLSVKDIKENRRYESIYELWIECDPYKHRLMRICGIPEHFITGEAEAFDKFEKFLTVLPYLAGSPVYDWSRMELSRIFGIDELPTKENARYIYEKCGEMLSSSEFSNNAILSRFNIEYQSPVATLLEDISAFDVKSVAPSLRADDLLSPSLELKKELSKRTGICASDEKGYIAAIGEMLDRFKEKGCKFADHALDSGFFNEGINSKKAEMLVRLMKEYSSRGMTLLLHLDANRKTSSRLSGVAGPFGGYAAVGGSFDVSALIELINKAEEAGGLPDTVLFPLNINDQAPLAVISGSFAEDNTPAKVQLGPAWWWCDHKLGIENTLSAISSFGVLSEFIGMTTDSRSILSFIRHDYFRRILSSWLDKQNSECDLGLPTDILEDIAKKICYENAKRKIER